MDYLQGIDEERKNFEKEGEKDKTRIFDITPLEENSTIKSIKNKSEEIANKNIKLTKYQKLLYRQRYNLLEEYKEKKEKLELEAITDNNSKKRGDKFTKDQLNVFIDSKIDLNLRKAIRNVEHEISICELISKNHYRVSEEVKSSALSETAYQKYIKSDKL